MNNIATTIIGLAVCLLLGGPTSAQAPAPQAAWSPPDPDTLPDTDWGRTVRYGRDLTTRTFALLGPEAPDPTAHFSGSNLACSNCHLQGGTKEFGLPFVGVFADFPQYRAREGEVGTIEDRVNGCMTRSMNGRPLPADSEAMKAFVAYIKFLSTNVPIGAETKGRGSAKLLELTRPADPARGEQVYADNCAACHGADGAGKRIGNVGDAQGYEFPPLWGPDSYNDGAGMNRLISVAGFVHSNMPNGTTFDEPILSAEDAWDVGAFLVSRPRPCKADLDQDYPKRLEKAVDAAYGPYADGFTQPQHAYGPYTPIRDALKKLNAAEPAAAGD